MISVSKGKGRMGRGRAPCCEKVGLKRGAWTAEEDDRLVSHIQKHGHTNWRALPKQAGLLRCGKSCRLRWFNYLRPDIKRGDFSPEEVETLISLHRLLGNSWSKIAAHLPGRTDNGIKNVWNTHIKKRLQAKENPSPCSSSISVEFKCDQDHRADIDVWDVLNAESQPQVVALPDTDAKHDADGILDEEVSEKGRWLSYLEEELGILEEQLGLFNAAGIEEDCGNGSGG